MRDRNNYKLLFICLCGLFSLNITLPARSQKDSPLNISKLAIKRQENETLENSYPINRFTDEELISQAIENLWIDRYFKNKDSFKKKDNAIAQPKQRIVSDFYEGLAKFEQDGKYGYVDEQGNIAVAAKYDEAGNFSEQLAAVVLDGKSLFIDGAGRVVITLKDYDAYSNYREQHMAFGGDLPFVDYLYTLSEFNNGVAEISKPKLPRDYQYKTQEEANAAKEFLCNAIDRTGKIISEDRLCDIESI